MSIQKKFDLSDRDVDRIIGMAWEDRTTFDAIYAQFGLTEKDVIKLMKQHMKLRNWKKWRARVQGRKTKHAALRRKEIKRFRSASQRLITKNHISKKKY